MRRSNISFMALAALAALTFAACSSSSKPASSTTTTSSPAASTSAPAASTSAAPTTAGTTAKPTVGTATSSLGKILVDSKGLPLYTYGMDTAGTSNCTGGCASAWPPVAVTGTPTYAAGLTASKFSTITRSDGSKQLALNGLPLYTFAADTAGAAPTGNGVNNFKVAMASDA